MKRCRKNARKGVLLGVLLKESIDNLLPLSHKLLAFLETVGFALDVDDGAVMQDEVKDSGDDGDIRKDLVPLVEDFVGSKNGGGLLTLLGNELKEEIGTLNVYGEIADFVNDEDLIPDEDFELVRQQFL